MRNLLPCAALCACLAGCITDGAKGSPERPAGTVFKDLEYVPGNGYLLFPPQERIHYDCGDDDKLVTTVTTSIADSAYFKIIGDTLFLGLFHAETLASGAKVQGLDRFLRKGGGSGIGGQWVDLRLDRVYWALSGEPTAQEQAQLDRMGASARMDDWSGHRTLLFEDGKLSFYFDFEAAENFLASWNGRDPESPEKPDSATYAVSVRIVDKNTVELIGRENGEVIRIAGSDPYVRTFTSDHAGHEAYTSDQSPETCPRVRPTPAWYDKFLEENLKP